MGLLGASALAFYPSHIFWSHGLSDVYFTMWFSLAVFVLLRTREMTGGWLVADGVLGLVTAFATGARPGVLLVPLVFVYWALLRGCGAAFERTTLVVGARSSSFCPGPCAMWRRFSAPSSSP